MYIILEGYTAHVTLVFCISMYAEPLAWLTTPERKTATIFILIIIIVIMIIVLVLIKVIKYYFI